MPRGIANQDSSDGNFASQRYEGVGFEIECKVTQRMIDTGQLNPTFESWRREAEISGVIDEPSARYRRIWRWPKEDRHTDPLKSANAGKVRIETGQATVGDIVAERGGDPDTHERRLSAEIRRYRENGIIHPLAIREQGLTDAAMVEDQGQ